MAITKVAKILTGSIAKDTLTNETIILEKENGDHKGARLSYKSNDSVVRLLSPLEEFEKFYSFSNTTDNQLATPNVINILPGYSSIVVIDSTVRAEDVIVTLPEIDVTSLDNGIYYTYNVRIAVDTNSKGFTIRKNPNSTGTIYGKDSIIINKQYTSFDVFLSPDNKWRIHGVYEIYADGTDNLLFSY